MPNHDDPAYLEGLSDLDRARAIVAVNWCGARWMRATFTDGRGAKFKDDGRRLYPEPDMRFYKEAEPSLRIDPERWLRAHSILGTDEDELTAVIESWGTSWAGSASLMTLAENKGWRLTSLYEFNSPLDMPPAWTCYLTHGDFIASDNTVDAPGETIHAAVLAACAEAAKRGGE